MTNVKRFVRESKQNSLLGQKRRKQILFGSIGVLTLLFVSILMIVISPTALATMAVVPLLAGIQKKGDEPVTIEDTQTMLTNMYENLKESLSPQMEAKFNSYQEEIKKLIANNVSDETLQKKFDDFKTQMDEVIAGLNKGDEQKKSTFDEIVSQLEAKKADIKDKKDIKVEIKAISSAELVAPLYNTEVDPNVKMSPIRRATFLDRITKYPLGKRTHVKVSAASTVSVDYQGEGAYVVVDSSVATAAEVSYNTAKLKAVVRAISREALEEDTPFVMEKVWNQMRAQLRLKLETESLTGLGATGTPNKIWGIIPQFTTAFSATGIPKVATPHLLDLSNACALQAKLSPNDTEYFPNVLVISPAALFELQSQKDTLGNYLLVDGLLAGTYEVIANRTLTKDQMLLLDMNTIEMYVAREFEIELLRLSYEIKNEGGTVTGVYSDNEYDTYTALAWFRGMQTMNPVDKAGNIYVANITTALGQIKLT